VIFKGNYRTFLIKEKRKRKRKKRKEMLIIMYGIIRVRLFILSQLSSVDRSVSEKPSIIFVVVFCCCVVPSIIFSLV